MSHRCEFVDTDDRDIVAAKVLTGGLVHKPDLTGVVAGQVTSVKVRWCLALAYLDDFRAAAEAVEAELSQPATLTALQSLHPGLIGRDEASINSALSASQGVSVEVATCLAKALSNSTEADCLRLQQRLEGEAFQVTLAEVANQFHPALTGPMSAGFVSRFVMYQLLARDGAKTAHAYAELLRTTFASGKAADDIEHWFFDHLRFVDLKDLRHLE